MAPVPAHLTGVPIGERELARETKLEHQRRRILHAATAVFAKRGYQATKVSHVVKAASSSTGHFYSLFESKEACFLAAYDLAIAEGTEAISVRIPADGAWPEQVAAALSALGEWIAAQNFAARLVIVETQSAGAAALARYQETLRGLVPLLRRGRELTPAGEALPKSLETSALGGVTWILHERLVASGFEPSAELHSELFKILAGPYLGEAETKRFLASIG
jgi:AcrR family transcriptional regulator